MIISIASGKGGTGKTFITTNLARSLEKNVAVYDCDVEAPNSHLFLRPDVLNKTSFVTTVPAIDLEKCTFCKKCMEICRFNAIAILKENALVFPELCHSCGGCFRVCEDHAINETDRVLGDIEIGKAGHIDLVHGRLGVGQVMAPRLIEQVKSHTKEDTVNIIDAPPGTSCPVITSIKNSDFVVLVTEPTPFGLHDLKLAVEGVRALNLSHGIIINRAGKGDDQVTAYASKENIDILMEIPFDRSIAETYSNGDIYVDTHPEMKKAFKTLFDKIQEQIHHRRCN